MQNWRQITHEAKDILTVCLAKGIHKALTAQLGENWFADFAEADAREKVSVRITKAGQHCVQDMDLQALLKFLRYRSALTTRVLQYYGFFAHMDSFAADDQLRQLNALLDRLINDFRNRIEAHSRAADIEIELSGHDVHRIYGYEEAYQDMYKLTKVFSCVTDSQGTPYHSRMAQLTGKKKKKLLPIFLAAAAVLTVGVVAALLLFLGGGEENVFRDVREPVVHREQITVQPTQVFYDGDALVALCYVTNGTSQTVFEPEVYSFRVFLKGQELAAADFGILEDAQIKPGKTLLWTFRFPAQTVFIQNAELTDLQTQVLCRYE